MKDYPFVSVLVMPNSCDAFADRSGLFFLPEGICLSHIRDILPSLKNDTLIVLDIGDSNWEYTKK